jgi:hypothetical protein
MAFLRRKLDSVLAGSSWLIVNGGVPSSLQSHVASRMIRGWTPLHDLIVEVAETLHRDIANRGEG